MRQIIFFHCKEYIFLFTLQNKAWYLYMISLIFNILLIDKNKPKFIPLNNPEFIYCVYSGKTASLMSVLCTYHLSFLPSTNWAQPCCISEMREIGHIQSGVAADPCLIPKLYLIPCLTSYLVPLPTPCMKISERNKLALKVILKHCYLLGLSEKY